MTRLNVIPVCELSDSHLLSELREAPRLFTHVEKYGIKPSKIPPDYVLGKGHVHFFTNKLAYVYKRVIALHKTCLKRGIKSKFNLDDWRRRYATLPPEFKVEYLPSREAMAINRKRIQDRIRANPKQHRYYGAPFKTKELPCSKMRLKCA